MSAVDAAWQRLKAATAPAAMAGSRLSAASAAAPPAQPRGDGGGSAITAALDGGAAGSADLAVQATAGNPGETVKLRDARVELILTQRLRQRGAAQTASGGSAAKKPVPSWVWDLGLRPLPHSAPESDAAGSDARGERSSGKAAGGAEGALGSAERGGAGQAEGRGDDGVREGGNMEVDEGNGRRSGEGNKEGDVARENTTAAAAAGAERAAAAAAALRATRAAAGGAVVDDSKVQVREVVDFAGEAVEVVRVLDARSKEAAAAKRKADMQASTSKGLDAILAQMEKKKKLNILDKSRKDWSEYKEGTGVVEELEEYRRSGATYTEKRAFLGQADLREYERERDAKLAAQARRARPGGVD
ncbi:unnamed protein product [Closterium sp. NIES-65]|nr:unnamed protein product [Closterium sp. NIES-65]